jgi:hypothetical protein
MANYVEAGYIEPSYTLDSLYIDWGNKLIIIPRGYTELVQETPTEIRQLHLNQFRQDLKDLEDDVEGMAFLDTHSHNTEVLLGGIVYARVITIINGYTITFEDGQYAVNLIGANSNVGDNINVNQVSVRSANSAGLISNQAIEYSSFQGGVTIDVNSSYNGVAFPIGTPQQPVNNMADAHFIMAFRGFNKMYFLSDWTFTSDTYMIDHEIYGQGSHKTVFTFEAGCILGGVEVFDCTVTGFGTGIVSFKNCLIKNLGSVGLFPTSIDVIAQDSFFEGYTTLLANYSGTVTAVDCWAMPDELGNPPVIDMGNSTADLQARNWSGILHLKNNTNVNDIRIFLATGGVILDSTITAGNLLLSGVGILTDNSTGVTTLNTDSLLNRELITKASWTEVHYDTVNGVAGTKFPIGTATTPSNNLADLLIIANNNNIKHVDLDSSILLTESVAGFEFEGGHGIIVDFNGQSIYGSSFTRCGLTGTMVGEHAFFKECDIYALSNIGGSFERCWFNLTTPITVASGVPILMSGGVSAVPGSDSPVLDYSNGGILFNMRAYSGGIRIINSTDAFNTSTFEFIAGKFNFGVVNTAGYFAVRGVVDTTGIDVLSTATVNLDGANTGGGGGTAIIDYALVANAVWDEPLIGSTHNIPTSAGRRLREIIGPILTGNVVSSTINTVTFNGDASTADGAYDPGDITIINGLGAGQSRLILEYNGTTKTAVLDRNWKIQPDDSSEYAIFPSIGREHVNEGAAQGGTINTITLNANASSADNAYSGQLVFIRSGTGDDQVGIIVAYNGTTKIATVEKNWASIPDNTSGYIIIPSHVHTADELNYWSEDTRDEVIAWARKSSDNAEQTNLKL